MADLVIRKADLWVEVEGFEAWISSYPVTIGWIWGEAAKGAAGVEAIQSLLDEAEILPEGFRNRVAEVRLIALPDDMRGSVHRMWLRRKPYPQDWTPGEKKRRR